MTEARREKRKEGTMELGNWERRKDGMKKGTDEGGKEASGGG